jgi:GT2 family glycosyltransferase
VQENLVHPTIQILMVTHGRARLLRRLLLELRSLIPVATFHCRVQVVVNGLDVLTEEMLRDQGNSVIQWIVLQKAVSPSAARAEGLKRLTGFEWIWFLDDDVSVPEETFQKIQLMVKDPSVDVFGGPNLTPMNSSWRQHIIGALLENPFVVGPVSQRYRQNPKRNIFSSDDRALMLCHLFVRSSLFQSELFLPGLLCGEENYFLCVLKERGAYMVFSSQIPVYHERREAFGSFLVQIQKYGLGRGQLLRALGPHRMGWFSWCFAGGFLFCLSILILGNSGGIFWIMGAYAILFLLAVIWMLTSSVSSIRTFLISLVLIPALQAQYFRGLIRGTLRGSEEK